MGNRSQVTLKWVLAYIAVLSVPLAMIGSRSFLPATIAVIAVLPLVGGRIGYALAGWKGAIFGLLTCSLISFLAAACLVSAKRAVHIPAN